MQVKIIAPIFETIDQSLRYLIPILKFAQQYFPKFAANHQELKYLHTLFQVTAMVDHDRTDDIHALHIADFWVESGV